MPYCGLQPRTALRPAVAAVRVAGRPHTLHISLYHGLTPISLSGRISLHWVYFSSHCGVFSRRHQAEVSRVYGSTVAFLTRLWGKGLFNIRVAHLIAVLSARHRRPRVDKFELTRATPQALLASSAAVFALSIVHLRASERSAARAEASCTSASPHKGVVGHQSGHICTAAASGGPVTLVILTAHAAHSAASLAAHTAMGGSLPAVPASQCRLCGRQPPQERAAMGVTPRGGSG